MNKHRRVLARIDSYCARMNGGLAFIALVLASLVIAMASVRAPSLFPPSPQSQNLLLEESEGG